MSLQPLSNLYSHAFLPLLYVGLQSPIKVESDQAYNFNFEIAMDMTFRGVRFAGSYPVE